MGVLIDPPAWRAHGTTWSHLVSDASFDELHAFAARAGLPAGAFEGDHYDVPRERYAACVAAGAEPVTGRELLTRLVAAGLRRPKRRGERVVGSRPLPGGRLDVLTSPHLPPVERLVEVRVLDVRAEGVVLLAGALPLGAVADGPPAGHLRRTTAGEGGADGLATARYALLVRAAATGAPAPLGQLLDPDWRALVTALLAPRGPRPPH